MPSVSALSKSGLPRSLLTPTAQLEASAGHVSSGLSFPCGHQSCHLYNVHFIIYSSALPALNPDAFLCLQGALGAGCEGCGVGAYLAQSSTERRRWAMNSTVHCANQLPRAACIWRSVPGSTAAVASSRMRIWVFRRRARARHRSCFWPRLGMSGTGQMFAHQD